MVYGACLFADIAGYTTLSEKMTPQQLSDLMHKYFEATFEPVKKHGGMVVNLKGDSFLAIWKAARADFQERMKDRKYTTLIPKGQKAPKSIR